MSALGFVAGNLNKLSESVEKRSARLWGGVKMLLTFPAKVLYKALVVAPFMALVGLAGAYLPAAVRGVSAFVAPVASKVAPYIPGFVSNSFAAAGSFFAAAVSKIGSFIPASVSARFSALVAKVSPYAPATAAGLLAGKSQREASRTEIKSRSEATADSPDGVESIEVEHGVSRSDVVLETVGGVVAQAAARQMFFAGVGGPAGFALSALAYGAGAALVDTAKNDVAPRLAARFRADS